MKRTLINMAVLGSILGASMAHAGGWDRSGQDTSIILKEGNLLEISSASVSPKVTGTYTGTSVSTGDGVPNYNLTSLAFRSDVSDDIAFAVIQDTPFGAEVDWVDGTRLLSFRDINAKVESSAITALVSYDVENLTIYGGLKSQSFKAQAANPFVGLLSDPADTTSIIGDGTGYSITSEAADQSIGYVLGGAIEKPEIGMKVSLTYHAKVKHDVSVVETVGGNVSDAEILSTTTPDSFNLDFQTGVAENTLVYGSVRHVKWTQLELRPDQYALFTGGLSLKTFKTDTTSYSLGVAHKLSDQWLASASYGTESPEGGNGSPLGPTDGYSKMGLGLTYIGQQATVTVGVQQINMGDTLAVVSETLTASMADNTAIVTAVKVGYKF